MWKKIHEEQELYFPGQEVVGWFFSEPETPMETTEVFNRVHRHYFGGDKVFMLREPVEREDALFRFENNFLVRQSGYYLYIEGKKKEEKKEKISVFSMAATACLAIAVLAVGTNFYFNYQTLQKEREQAEAVSAQAAKA